MNKNAAMRLMAKAGLGLLSCSFNMLAVASHEKEVIGSGDHVKLDSSSPVTGYVLTGNARLDSNGATIDNISAGSSTGAINLSNGTLVRNGMNAGGRLTINSSTVKGEGRAALVIQYAGKGIINDSVIESETLGLSLTGSAVATVKNTKVSALGGANSGEGWGVGVFGARAEITAGSEVIGSANGIYMTHARGGPGVVWGGGQVLVDDATVTALSGAAIKVAGREGIETANTIDIRNGAKLVSGSNSLLEVENGVTVFFNVQNTHLTGSLSADESSVLNVRLEDNSTLTGNIINGNHLHVASTAQWLIPGANELSTLSASGGRVSFVGDGFHSLTVGELSGLTTFDMRINLDNGTGDLLNIAGQARGVHRLNIENTGQEAVPAEFDALRVVHTEGGDARFGLTGERADLGVYSYALEQQGTDWFIVGSGKVISPSTQSALALFNVGPTIWNSELTTLRSRMGEVRGQEQGGGWIRSYGSRFKASLDSGVNYQQKQQGLSFGADAPVSVSDGHLLVGLMGGYSNSDLDLRRGTSGEVDSYYVGAYGTWLSDDGYYLDGVLKVNQFHNQSKVAMSDGKKAKGDYSNMAVGGSVEFGKHIKLPDDYFVEPYAQLSSVWIEGDSYTLDNGMQAKTSQTQSVLGKVGATVGRQFALKDGGFVQPYVRVAAAHEFSRSDDVSVNNQRFDNDLFGSRAELGGGVSVSLSERLQVHADFDYMKGKHVEQPWGANLGLRLAF